MTSDVDGFDFDDPEAWESAYLELKRAALQVLLGMGIPKEDAEEIANDCILQAASKLSQSSSGTVDDLKGLIRAMAKFDGIDFFRRKGSQKMGGGKVSSLDEEVGEQGQTRKDMIPSGNQEGIDEVEKNDIWSFLLDCLRQRLSESESLFIIKFFFQGWTQREISEMLEVKIGSIGTTIKRSLLKLENCLEVKGVHNPFV